MNDLIEGARLEGSIKFGDEEINHQHCDVVELRRRIGMVFQRPTPFAKSIFENVVYGLKVSGVRNKSLLMDKAEESLRRAALWDEVRIASKTLPFPFPAVSSNDCVLQGLWQ